MSRCRNEAPAKTSTKDIPAGQFSVWLKDTISVMHGEGEADVPCAECSACCRSSYFVHIKPSDVDTIAHVPKALTFAAPGLPKGHLLLGYNEQGCCPMLIDGACSIYEFRPQTCRQYDCRVFTASGVDVFDQDQKQGVGSGEQTQSITQRTARWAFELFSERDHSEFQAVQAAARFLARHADEFPPRFLPLNSTQQAVLAIEVYPLFLGKEQQSIAQTVNAIVAVHQRLSAK
jgi:Fe-S-cluster containining protein